ncbi:centriolar and ciliogenesis-associated protein HYLS1 isoform X2 [Genypterus blacodes]|uniref:centriolar and ciliogenesis-associated protein HYLS1 isoform X2 n=1 Tax=Genypterus blacodes TaxID=154954 RepID=UPI003F764F93
MDPNLDFSEEEIQEQLSLLGYRNISRHRLQEFKQDLDELIQGGKWKDPTPTDQRDSVAPERDGARPGPPAYTKGKVAQSPAEGFILHAGPGAKDRQVLTARSNRDDVQRQRRIDSYAQHSVAPRPRPLPPGPRQAEPENTEQLWLADSHASTLHSHASTPHSHASTPHSHASIPDSTARRFIKRKVLRKHKGQSLICDESVYSEDSDVASCLEELDLTASAQHQSHQGRTQSWEDDSTALSAFESYIRGMIQVQNGDVVRQKPKSFIRPALSQQTVRKDDPVAKYHQYKQVWEMCKIPGETDRRALRQEIKERLAYQPPPPKPRREFTPNTYTVPTEKKRSALRWEIRNALANRLLPHTCYRF